MITPLFDVSQCPDSVTITIRAPFSRPRDFQISSSGCDFHFHCAPYLLHLRFPGEVITDSDAASASYDFDAGTATVVLEKGEPGFHFPHLGSLSALLVKRTEGLACTPLPSAGIEVLGSTNSIDATPAIADPRTPRGAHESETPGARRLDATATLAPSENTPYPSIASICAPAGAGDAETLEERHYLRADSNNDVASEEVTCEALEGLTIGVPRYGFGDRYEGVFAIRAENTPEVVELPEPDATPVWRRRAIRKENETEAFDPEHYIADYMEASSEFPDVLDYRPKCIAERQFTMGEKSVLVNLPKREYLPDGDAQAAADLAGILFAACYDLRATLGERSCESAWSISRLTPVMSYLEHAESVQAALRSAYVASLTRPLYRHRGLSDLVLGDVQQMLSGNMEDVQARLLRTLLDLRGLYEDSPLYRLFSDVFLTDYCIWIQRVGDGVLTSLAEEVGLATIPVNCLPWDLLRLQKYAEQIENNEEPADEAPVWEWTGLPNVAKYRGLGDGSTSLSSRSEEAIEGKTGLVPQPELPEQAPGVVISAQPLVQSASFDSLEEYGIRAVTTKAVVSSSVQGSDSDRDSNSDTSSSQVEGSLSNISPAPPKPAEPKELSVL